MFEQVTGLSVDDRKNKFTLKSLERQAKSLSLVDPVVSSMCLGIIFFYENKPDNVRHSFTKAIRRFPDDSILVHNYAVTLRKMGFYRESLEFADTAYRLNQTDPFFLETVYSANILNGKFDTAHELRLIATKLRLNSERITTLNNILQFIRSNSISPSYFLMLQDSAYSLLHSRNIFIMHPSLEICEDEDSMFLTYNILLDKPVSEIVDLSIMHARALAQEPSFLDISNKVIISFTSWCE